jgi:hypothetical protein
VGRRVTKVVGVGALFLLSACSATSGQSASSASGTGSASAPTTVAGSVTPGAAKGGSGKPTITGVSFKGDVSKPVISVRGTNFGQSPPPNPPHTMGGHPPCPTSQGNEGLDYGTLLHIADQSSKWGAGRYRPEAKQVDCVGLVVTAFTPTEVVFQLGSAYADSQGKDKLQEGDSFTLGVESATYSGKVHYSG